MFPSQRFRNSSLSFRDGQGKVYICTVIYFCRHPSTIRTIPTDYSGFTRTKTLIFQVGESGNIPENRSCYFLKESLPLQPLSNKMLTYRSYAKPGVSIFHDKIEVSSGKGARESTIQVYSLTDFPLISSNFGFSPSFSAMQWMLENVKLCYVFV